MCLICDQKGNINMASIYFRLDKSGNKRYYGSIYNNGKRIRKFLGCSRQSAEAVIKKLEYEILLNIESFDVKPNHSILNKPFFHLKRC